MIGFVVFQRAGESQCMIPSTAGEEALLALVSALNPNAAYQVILLAFGSAGVAILRWNFDVATVRRARQDSNPEIRRRTARIPRRRNPVSAEASAGGAVFFVGACSTGRP